MKDIETLSWLRNECSKEQFNYRPTSTQETQYFLEHSPYAYLEVFFALLEKQSVGYLVVAIDDKFNTEKNVKAGIILAVGVLKQHRRQGIGSALTLHGLKVLTTKQMTSAFLDVDDLNQTGALKLYEKLGFKVSEKYLTYENSFD
jgi:ribosomal protein S18 acetylase RimI-like enzyme